MKKSCIAMLLAGGQGSRLKELTHSVAKPAVHFGGKYRIIDFPLTNCSHSGIDTVGVLTQYEPLELNSYIGVGRGWDLDVSDGGVSVLPPYSSMNHKDVTGYAGTADAIYQNIQYIDIYNPEYVLILSGDHIYTMDYSRMYDYAVEKKSDAVISVMEVPMEDAPRFGIMNTDDNMNIVEFEEKPANPKSNLASMGIYMFKWSTLRKILIADANNPDSAHDFGKNIIPTFLAEKKKTTAYPFKGYWKDVGTVRSLWEANMDLLDCLPELNLYNQQWPILSVNHNLHPKFMGNECNVEQSLINEGVRVFGNVAHSVISYGSRIGKGSVVKDSVIMPDVIIEEDVYLEKVIVKQGTVIKKGFKLVGSDEIALLTNDTIKEMEGVK